MSRDKFRLLILLVIVGAAIFGVYHHSLQAARREKAEGFVRRYIRLVQANDLQTAYHLETTERFRGLVNFQKFATDYSVAFRKLGELVSYKSILWLEPSFGRDYYQLDYEAVYQHDTGKLRFTLALEGDQFKLLGFFVGGDHWEALKEKVEE